MERGDGTLIAGDTITDLITDLIDDYPLENPEAQLTTRTDYAVTTATVMQAARAFATAIDGGFDIETETEEAVTALFSDRDLPILEIETWDHSVALVLVRTHYAPFTDTPAPTGNVTWIDPSDELTLIRSLEHAGEIRLWIDGQ